MAIQKEMASRVLHKPAKEKGKIRKKKEKKKGLVASKDPEFAQKGRREDLPCFEL